jgi:hypothetical protein
MSQIDELYDHDRILSEGGKCTCPVLAMLVMKWTTIKHYQCSDWGGEGGVTITQSPPEAVLSALPVAGAPHT